MWRVISIMTCAALFPLAGGARGQEAGSFLQAQKKFPRVRVAGEAKDAAMRSLFQHKGLPYPPKDLLLRAFKKEAQLELWVGQDDHSALTLVKTYAICATSGRLGPKRRFGDEQVPEGFYELDWFNPQSNFYLSMHISYPNAADRILKTLPNAGGDIFLHGNCVTIGCIPITDDGIKEVYWLGVLAHASGQKHLPIYIFPARLTESGLNTLKQEEHPDTRTLSFWQNLQEGFALFENTHKPLDVRVRRDGRYEFSGEISSGGVH